MIELQRHITLSIWWLPSIAYYLPSELRWVLWM